MLPFTIPRMKAKHFMQPVEILATNDQCVPEGAQSVKGRTLTMQEAPPLKNSLQIKAAEYWLKLGEADQALRELEAQPSGIWTHRWALKTRIAATGALRGRDEMTAQA
jgi:hypothetical protein